MRDTQELEMTAATKLREQLNRADSFVLLPGVYDGFSARVALEVGFDGLYMVDLPTCIPHDQILTLAIRQVPAVQLRYLVTRI
jgi:hypothetical protein